MSKKSNTQLLDKLQEQVDEVNANIEVLEHLEVTQILQPTMRVGARAKQLILQGELDNKGILAVLQKEYPQGKTSMACIAWYKSDLKKSKPVDGYTAWLKANELELRAKYEASLVVEQA